ncbi:MAG: glycine--tRNA ligase subunit beta [Methylophilaceae bacterium]
MEKNPHNKNLLVELFVEELPPKALNKLGEAFSSVLFESLKTQGLTLDNASVTGFATPRRLAAHVMYVKDKADDKQVSQKLMPANVGLDAAGKATPALIKKLQSLGVDALADELVVSTLKNDNNTLFLDALQTGVTLPDGLQLALNEALAKLPIPKVMTYQLHENTQNPGWDSVDFVRPAHSLVAMHGSSTLDVSVLGLKSGNTTQGHRFEAKNAVITLSHADTYEAQLLTEGAVIASFATRKAEILKQLNAAAAKENLSPINDDALLDEVTALVERPNVLLGQFEPEYLEVPQECLILTMKANQKYFPLLGANGKLTNKFLIVSNINPADPSAVIGGNERVVRPRLADAKFFFDQDRKKTLESHIAGLDKVVYHNKLGSQGERNARVVAIAKSIAQQLGDESLVAKVEQAARLSKVDLLTDMVGEFPELQGIMGRYYAQHEKLDNDVAFAIEDHYKPRFAGDELPRNKVGVCVALADKLETLVGMFGTGNTPTGDKDPFALRRHALGIIRILIENDIPISLTKLVDLAVEVMPQNARPDWAAPVIFMLDRARSYFEEKGFNSKAIESVLSPWGMGSPLGPVPAIVAEATKFISTTEGQELAQNNKRITNILKKSNYEVPFGLSPKVLKIAPDTSKFTEDAERALYSALWTAGELSLKLKEDKRYADALSALIPLSLPVSDFFDKVMVNVEDEQIRDNRITLLQHARAYMNLVADLSLMAS